MQSIENEGIVDIETLIEKEHIHLIICDNGSEIKEENLSKITDPYYTTKSPGKGSGLNWFVNFLVNNKRK